MSIARLHKSCLFSASLVLCVVHENLARYVRKGRIKASSYQNATIVQAYCHWIRLQRQILRYLLFRPYILVKVIVQDKILVVGISKEVNFWDGFKFIVKVLVGVSIRELYHGVLQASNTLKHWVHNLRVKTDCALFELMERRIICAVNSNELFFKPF